jgi:hypothetical protein
VSAETQLLPVRRNSFLAMNLRLDDFDAIGWFDFDANGRTNGPLNQDLILISPATVRRGLAKPVILQRLITICAPQNLGEFVLSFRSHSNAYPSDAEPFQ